MYKKTFNLIALLILSVIMLLCNQNPASVVGNGSQTGNPVIIGSLKNQDKTPAVGVRVNLFNADHTPSLQKVLSTAKNMAPVTDSVFTDKNGIYQISNLAPGIYNIVATAENGKTVFIDSIFVKDSTVEVPTDTIKAPGRIEGRTFMPGLDSINQIRVTMYMPGTGFIVKPNIGGIFTFNSVPEGSYRIIFDPTNTDYYVKIIEVKVNSGMTLNLDTVVLYGKNQTGIPLVNAGRDTVLSIGDTIALHGTASDIWGTIRLMEWDIGASGKYNKTDGDTVFALPDSEVNDYKCILRVIDNDSNIVYDTVHIKVLKDAPVVTIEGDSIAFLGAPQSYKVKVTQRFGSILKYVWKSDSGTAVVDSTGMQCTCIFKAENTFSVSVMVIDDDGNSVQKEKRINVINDTPGIIGLRDTVIGIGDTISYSVSASDRNGIKYYIWNFGDVQKQFDTTLTGDIKHIYPKIPSRCTTSVTAIDSFGKPGYASSVVEIVTDAPIVNVGNDTIVQAGTPVNFSAIATQKFGTIKMYLWDFESDGVWDDSGSSAMNIAHLYSLTGKYQMKVKVIDDDGNEGSASKNITVATIIDKSRIESNEIWTKAASPYVVSGDLYLAKGTQLTIEPGVRVLFGTDVSMLVDGTLISRGSVTDSIFFGYNGSQLSGTTWGSIKFLKNSGYAESISDSIYVKGSILEYCIIEGGRGTILDRAAPFFHNCTVKRSRGQGINAIFIDEVLSGKIYVIDCTLLDNDSSGIYCALTPEGGMVVHGNLISGNKEYGVYKGNTGVNAFVISDNRIERNTLYGIKMLVGNDPTPDTISNNLIVSNGGGIEVFGWSFAILNNEIISNGTQNIDIDGSALNIHLQYGQSLSVSMTGNTLSGNKGKSSIYLKQDYTNTPVNLTVNGNNFTDTTHYQVYNNTQTEQDFKNNWWGTKVLSEIEARVYDSFDDPALENVITEPFLSSPVE